MKKVILILLCLGFFCSGALAQEITASTEVTSREITVPAKQRFNIGAGYWYTWAKMDMKLLADTAWINSGLANKGDKVSELDNDLDSGMVIVNAEAWIWWRLYVDGFIGWGNCDGSHEDSDWIPAMSGGKWSLSKSDASGDVVTLNANGYLRIIDEPEDKGYLDFSLGYFYYKDDIEHIKNTRVEIYNWGAVNIPLSGHDSSDRYTFDGLRLGARGKIRIMDRLALKGSIGVCPWLDVKKKWYWNLAGHKGTGDADGTAFDVDVSVEFKITKNIFIEAGYKYINLNSDDGDLHWDYYNSGLTETDKNVWNVEGHRGGFYGMGRLKF